MDFIVNNYIWFIVGGIIAFMAIIGYIAEKTDFGREEFEKKVKTVKEPKAPKVKKQKKNKNEVPIIDNFINDDNDIVIDDGAVGVMIDDMDWLDPAGLTGDKDEIIAEISNDDIFSEIELKDPVMEDGIDDKDEIFSELPLEVEPIIIDEILEEPVSGVIEELIDEPILDNVESNLEVIQSEEFTEVPQVDDVIEVMAHDEIKLPNIDTLGPVNDEEDIWKF